MSSSNSLTSVFWVYNHFPINHCKLPDSL